MKTTRIAEIYRERIVSHKVWSRFLAGSAIVVGGTIAENARPRAANTERDLLVAFAALGDQIRVLSAFSRLEGINEKPLLAATEAAASLANIFDLPLDRAFSNYGAGALPAAAARAFASRCTYRRALVPFPFATQAIDLAYALTMAEEVVASEVQPGVDFIASLERVTRVPALRQTWLDSHEAFYKAVFPTATLSPKPRLNRAYQYRGDEDVALVHSISVAPERTLPSGLVKRILQEVAGLGLTPVLLGSAAQGPLLQALANLGGAACVASGKSLPEVATLMASAKLFIGVDSSMMHMADAVGVPSVVLYGPTRPNVAGPYYTRFVPVLPSKPGSRIMQVDTIVTDPTDTSLHSIDVEEVNAAIRLVLAGDGQPALT